LPAHLDIAAKLRSIIALEVERALAPYLEALDSARHRPAPQPNRVVAAGIAQPKRARRAHKAAAPVSFEIGQRVLYRQGRGQFAAKVSGIDQGKGFVEVTRESDGKQVLRPAAKLVAAPAPVPAPVPRLMVRVRRIENGALVERELPISPVHAPEAAQTQQSPRKDAAESAV
jgi:hypothetical protein